jgi:glycosyltransferase involved in cell wall biosynthesis
MLAGVPVVASDVVGVRDVVSHDETGLLVPPADPAALAAALLRLRRDEVLARRLAEAGRRAAIDRFDERVPALRVVRVYQELLARVDEPRRRRSGRPAAERSLGAR